MPKRANWITQGIKVLRNWPLFTENRLNRHEGNTFESKIGASKVILKTCPKLLFLFFRNSLLWHSILKFSFKDTLPWNIALLSNFLLFGMKQISFRFPRGQYIKSSSNTGYLTRHYARWSNEAQLFQGNPVAKGTLCTGSYRD